MFRNWRLRKVGVNLFGISAEFERNGQETDGVVDVSEAAGVLRNGISEIHATLTNLEDGIINGSLDSDFACNQINEIEIWVKEADGLVEDIAKVDNHEAADLWQRLAGIYDRLADIIEKM